MIAYFNFKIRGFFYFQFIIFCLVATSFCQQATEGNPIALEQAKQDDSQVC